MLERGPTVLPASAAIAYASAEKRHFKLAFLFVFFSFFFFVFFQGTCFESSAMQGVA